MLYEAFETAVRQIAAGTTMPRRAVLCSLLCHIVDARKCTDAVICASAQFDCGYLFRQLKRVKGGSRRLRASNVTSDLCRSGCHPFTAKHERG